MKPQRFSLALDQLRPTDWARFERFASSFLAPDFPSLRTVGQPTGDRGRDAELFAPENDPNVLLQYSVTADWKSKISQTLQRIEHEFPEAQILVYVSNQDIGAKADESKKISRRDYRVTLDIRDRSWFLDRYSLDQSREELAEKLAEEFVDPLLPSDRYIGSKAEALSNLEARAGLLFLELQWEDDTREKGLTKISFEALVRAALRHTDPDNPLSRQGIYDRIMTYLPTHALTDIKRFIDAALIKLTKTSIRHHSKMDAFTLTYEERKKLAARLAEGELRDKEVDKAIASIAKTILDDKYSNEQTERSVPRIRRCIEKHFVRRASIFAAGVKSGRLSVDADPGIRDIFIIDISEKRQLCT